MGLGRVWLEDGELKMGNGYDQNRIQMGTSSAIIPLVHMVIMLAIIKIKGAESVNASV